MDITRRILITMTIGGRQCPSLGIGRGIGTLVGSFIMMAFSHIVLIMASGGLPLVATHLAQVEAAVGSTVGSWAIPVVLADTQVVSPDTQAVSADTEAGASVGMVAADTADASGIEFHSLCAQKRG
jgi:hypothetical protein